MLQLHDFLLQHRESVLTRTETKSLELAGPLASSPELRQGLPIFLEQLLGILRLNRPATAAAPDKGGEAKGAAEADEPAMAASAGEPEEAQLAVTAGLHGTEMFRLGYTLSHVVHAYGALCQAVTELAEEERYSITTAGFHDLNQCLDVAIAGAVTEYQTMRDTQQSSREVQTLGVLAHELRNALTSASISFQMVKRGTVGINGTTANMVEKSLNRMGALIDKSLTAVRLRVESTGHPEARQLLMVVDEILVSARAEAQSKNQTVKVSMDAELLVNADQQAFYSAVSNVIQNAIKFTPNGGTIEIRGREDGDHLMVEVEDGCGGLASQQVSVLFNAFAQRHQDRTGVGLGLTIARHAMDLNKGTIDVRNLPGRGCVFTLRLPRNHGAAHPVPASPAA